MDDPTLEEKQVGIEKTDLGTLLTYWTFSLWLNFWVRPWYSEQDYSTRFSPLTEFFSQPIINVDDCEA